MHVISTNVSALIQNTNWMSQMDRQKDRQQTVAKLHSA